MTNAFSTDLTPGTKQDGSSIANSLHPDMHNMYNWLFVAEADGTKLSTATNPSKIQLYEGSSGDPVTDHDTATMVISRHSAMVSPLDDSNAALWVSHYNNGRVQPVGIHADATNAGNSDACAFYGVTTISGIRGAGIGSFSDVTINEAVCTISHASPCVVTCTGHNLIQNDPVAFTGGTLPTGIVDHSAGGAYYVDPIDANNFHIYEGGLVGGGGTIVNTTSDGSGTHYVTGGKIFAYNPISVNPTHFDYTQANPALPMSGLFIQVITSTNKKSGAGIWYLGPHLAEGIIVETGAIDDYFLYDRGDETTVFKFAGSYTNIWDSSSATVSGYHIKMGSNFQMGFSTGEPVFAFGTGLIYIPAGSGATGQHAFYVDSAIEVDFAKGSYYLRALPTSSPGAGTKKLYYDNATGIVYYAA